MELLRKQDSTTKAASRLSAWHIAAYRRLWFGTVILALAQQCERLALGWFVLSATGSVFLTAASFAVQKAPSSLVSPLAGYMSDHLSRSKMIAATAIYKAVIVVLLGFLALGGVDHIWMVFVLVALSGIGRACETPATQGLITETVPPKVAMKAVALWSTGVKLVGALGGLFGGLVITFLGIPVALFVGSGIFLIGAIVMATMPQSSVEKPVRNVAGPGILLAAWKGLALILKLPIMRTLLLIAFVVETFGFAYQSVLPSFARDVLEVDADGLGILTLAAGCGSVIGVAILAMRGYFSHKGRLLIGVTIGYGLMLVGFALSGLFSLSLIMMMGVGAMAAVFDAIQWTLLQQHVPNDMRGRAIGGWVFATGFGWIGQLALGAMAQVLGVEWALMIAGALVALTGFISYGSSAKLREI